MKLHDDNKPEKVNQDGRDDMNILEFPITSLQRKPQKRIKCVISVEERIYKGAKIRMEQRITYGPNGQPGYSTNKLLLAIIEITKEQNNFTDRHIHCSIDQILRALRLSKRLSNKAYYVDMIIKDMEYLKTTSIFRKHSFWDNKTKHYVDLGFGIIEGFAFPTKKDEKDRCRGYATDLNGQFIWNEVYFKESFLKNNLKFIDLDFAFSLKHSLSLSIYRFLDKMRYFQPTIRFHLKTFAFEKLGMSKNYNSFEIKKYLDRAHKELKCKDFLKSWKYDQDKNGEWWVIYYLYEKDELQQTTTPKALPQPKAQSETKPLHPLALELIKRHVSQAVAIKLVEQYPTSDIQLQIEHYDYLLSKEKKVESAGWFVRAIPENWVPPVDFKSSTQLKQEEIARKKREKAFDEQQKLEAEKQTEQARLDLEQRKAFYNNPNQPEYDNLWKKVTPRLENEIGTRSFLMWFKPNFIAKIEGNTIYIDVPNTFFVKWLTKNYITNLKNTFTNLINEEAHISFLVNNLQPPQTLNSKLTLQKSVNSQETEKITRKTTKR